LYRIPATGKMPAETKAFPTIDPSRPTAPAAPESAMSDPETYDVYAIRYATREDRKRSESFISNAWTDPLHDAAMPIDYYVWALVNANRTIVVDAGFDRAEAKRRCAASGGVFDPDFNCEPAEGLARLGIDARLVEDVIITHMHFDHAGTLSQFPAARFHLQELELAYVTGRHMGQPYFRGPYTVDHIVEVVRHVFEDRVVFHAGDDEVAPGVTVHLIGGHTMGLQSVRVLTKRGWVMLASDASHFYENAENMAPFPIVYNVADMLAGFAKLKRLAESPQHLIPGHDPLVMVRYPAPQAELTGTVVRLDVAPKG
jgi:glyoxylase-like metal-dependent hydrolase (beta-lactamase superfamily II)